MENYNFIQRQAMTLNNNVATRQLLLSLVMKSKRQCIALAAGLQSDEGLLDNRVMAEPTHPLQPIFLPLKHKRTTDAILSSVGISKKPRSIPPMTKGPIKFSSESNGFCSRKISEDIP